MHQILQSGTSIVLRVLPSEAYAFTHAAWCTYSLGQPPIVLKQLWREDRHFLPGGPATSHDLAHFRRWQAVIAWPSLQSFLYDDRLIPIIKMKERVKNTILLLVACCATLVPDLQE